MTNKQLSGSSLCIIYIPNPDIDGVEGSSHIIIYNCSYVKKRLTIIKGLLRGVSLYIYFQRLLGIFSPFLSFSFVIERREEGGEGEDELDAEMEKEFEFFVQDLEEHLLNVGEMDPEQFQEQ